MPTIQSATRRTLTRWRELSTLFSFFLSEVEISGWQTC